ncbi:MAG: preprotein translocase subunit SecF [Candidatus Peregrinibacteria bacterium Gr01-1014_25]|nr:MAG: preprotein translocase subunit SecF [Candidatus Peregrinibacteria bacterium Gr01-1014_25]
MRFFRLAKFAIAVSGLLMAVSAVLLVVPGPRLSIEFTGGTLMEFALSENATRDQLMAGIRTFDATLGEATTVSATRTGTALVRTSTLSNEQHTALVAQLQKDVGELRELQFTTIGPTVGASLKRRSVIALALASAAIVLYLAVMFRSMPRGISSWSFGIAAIAALIHDILITVGIFSILSHTTSFQMDTLFVTALLSIMGYSVNDTIVIFDRVRDNLLIEGKRREFPSLAAESLAQSLRRTLSTGTGALIMLFALFFLASESIRWFTLTLIVGTIIGTYSSFFVATPLVVFWQERRKAGR